MKPAIAMILITALLDIMAMGIVMPVLPVLIHNITGSLAAASVWTGVIGSLWAIMQLLCAPIIGALSDRFGRRPVILISTAGLTLDWVLMGLAPNLWWLVVGRVIGGITTATGSTIFAYATDVSPPEQRTRAFGLIGAAMSAGFVGGPALGGLLGELGLRLPFWVAAALSLSAFLYGLLVLPESLAPERRMPFSWWRANPFGALKLLGSDRQLGAFSLSMFLIATAGRITTSVFVLYAGQRYGMDTLEVGALLTVAGMLDLLMQGVLVAPAVRRWGERQTVLIGLTGRALGVLALGLAPQGWLYALALVPNSMWGLAEPPLRSLQSARVCESGQGQLQGANHCLASLAGIVGPMFFGWLYALTSVIMPGLSFGVASAMILVALICSAVATAPPRAERRLGKGN
jgi:DHA1 family tetracycline resistance protein-like MFS transporter